MSRPENKPDPRDYRYVMFVNGRVNGLSDTDIADKLECESVAHLYQRLNADGYPVCSTCGAAPISKEHNCRSKRRPGSGAGKGTDLPAASQASELFTNTLRVMLARVADLDHRHESSQDGRIVGMDVFEGSSIYLSRRCEIEDRIVDNYSDEHWNKLCAQYEENPEVEGFWIDSDGLKRAAGAARSPTEPLTTLIGVYVLAGGDIERLLEALHPGPPAQNTREAIRKRVEGRKRQDKVDGLKTVAQQLATLVRGGKLDGAPPPGLSDVEHDAACYITMLREEKRSDEEILAKLSNHRTADGARLSMADVRRLGNLRLRYAET